MGMELELIGIRCNNKWQQSMDGNYFLNKFVGVSFKYFKDFKFLRNERKNM